MADPVFICSYYTPGYSARLLSKLDEQVQHDEEPVETVVIEEAPIRIPEKTVVEPEPEVPIVTPPRVPSTAPSRPKTAEITTAVVVEDKADVREKEEESPITAVVVLEQLPQSRTASRPSTAQSQSPRSQPQTAIPSRPTTAPTTPQPQTASRPSTATSKSRPPSAATRSRDILSPHNPTTQDPEYVSNHLANSFISLAFRPGSAISSNIHASSVEYVGVEMFASMTEEEVKSAAKEQVEEAVIENIPPEIQSQLSLVSAMFFAEPQVRSRPQSANSAPNVESTNAEKPFALDRNSQLALVVADVSAEGPENVKVAESESVAESETEQAEDDAEDYVSEASYDHDEQAMGDEDGEEGDDEDKEIPDLLVENAESQVSENAPEDSTVSDLYGLFV